MNNVARFVASGFGSGFAPTAPGTVGSAVAAVVWLALQRLELLDSYVAGVLLILACAVVGTAATAVVLRAPGNTTRAHDPQFVVIDEWLGMFITLFPCTIYGGGIREVIIGFLLFRLFDIKKPGLIRSAEALPGAWGVMTDDAVAGVAAALLLWVWICLVFFRQFLF